MRPARLAALKALRSELIDPKIAEHTGRIFKATGDGLLAEFPSVVNAVSCAIEIQRAMQLRNDELPEEKAIRLRIGINLGDVIVESDDVFGDGVNVAARIESIATPGVLQRGEHRWVSRAPDGYSVRTEPASW
jgi:adenylate cyclase